MTKTEKEVHLEALAAEVGKLTNAAYSDWGNRTKSGPESGVAFGLDRFAIQCAALSQAFDLLGQRASEVASETLSDDED
jgi:hypothetical protein